MGKKRGKKEKVAIFVTASGSSRSGSSSGTVGVIEVETCDLQSGIGAALVVEVRHFLFIFFFF